MVWRGIMAWAWWPQELAALVIAACWAARMAATAPRLGRPPEPARLTTSPVMAMRRWIARAPVKCVGVPSLSET